MKYIYQRNDWPNFRWDAKGLLTRLTTVTRRQGELIGQMKALGFQVRNEAVLQALTEEVVMSSDIEGEKLDKERVRSSIARRLGIEIAALPHADRHVEGVVEMMLDATGKFQAPLSRERLFGWHAALFPTGRSGMRKIRVGKWRDDRQGPMQVVSGPMGREKIHYEAPSAKGVPQEMSQFLTWFNHKPSTDLVMKAAIAHLWFVTIHPFEDGNGRMTRAIAEMALARAERSAQRFYSMSAQIRTERKAYYAILESTQKGNLDITEWLDWFLGCLDRALSGSDMILSSVLRKANFWVLHGKESFNDRQRKVLNMLHDGFEGKLTSSKWAKIGKCSQDTASRDIDDLLSRRILVKNPGGGRSTSYSLAPDPGKAA